MNLLFFIMLLIIILSIIILCICMLLSKNAEKEKEKSSPIECGMNPINMYNNPFSIQFFLIAILFMIFDVEIALIIPMPLTTIVSMYTFIMTSNSFLIILLIGLLYEWYNGALEWAN